MELRIRSQDRENLIRVENLCYFNTCNEMESVGKNYILNKSWIGDKDCIILGEYKSKERALEVLDEIQSILNLKNMYKYDRELVLKSWENVDKEKVKIVREQMSVYEMPKE